MIGNSDTDHCQLIRYGCLDEREIANALS